MYIYNLNHINLNHIILEKRLRLAKTNRCVKWISEWQCDTIWRVSLDCRNIQVLRYQSVPMKKFHKLHKNVENCRPNSHNESWDAMSLDTDLLTFHNSVWECSLHFSILFEIFSIRIYISYKSTYPFFTAD